MSIAVGSLVQVPPGVGLKSPPAVVQDWPLAYTFQVTSPCTKPRVSAAATGTTPDGSPVAGQYKFTDPFPMSDGLTENIAFFTLIYQSPLSIASNRNFGSVAPLLWLRAGAVGRLIDSLPNGWDVAEAYGVISDIDQLEAFETALAENPGVRHAFVISDEDRIFEAAVRTFPDYVETVRLYDAYLRNFEVEIGRASL